VYILCALTGLACAALLARAYRRTPSRLLLWSSVCFAALAANALLVVIDLMVLPQYDLHHVRLIVAAAGLLTMLWSLITEGAGREGAGP
jgi:hypothetical protein